MRHKRVIPYSLANLADSKDIIGCKMFWRLLFFKGIPGPELHSLIYLCMENVHTPQQTPIFQTDLTDPVRQQGALLKVRNTGRDLANSLISPIRI
jgi:hypothetical protein